MSEPRDQHQTTATPSTIQKLMIAYLPYVVVIVFVAVCLALFIFASHGFDALLNHFIQIKK